MSSTEPSDRVSLVIFVGLFVSIITFVVLFLGEPDLMDAIIHTMMHEAK